MWLTALQALHVIAEHSAAIAVVYACVCTATYCKKGIYACVQMQGTRASGTGPYSGTGYLPRSGSTPVTISNRTTPKLQMSADVEAGLPMSISGDCQARVPPL